MNKKAEDLLVSRTGQILDAQGYKLVDDAWKQFGRRTYIHDDDANRDCIEALARLLHGAGWRSHTAKVRSFCHPLGHEIELEPGGSEVGHFLHHVMPKQGRDKEHHLISR